MTAFATTRRRWRVVAVLGAVFVAVSPARSQPGFTVTGEIERVPQPGGDATYNLFFSASPFFPQGGVIDSLVGPDGVTRQPGFGGLTIRFANDLTLAEAQAAFSGTWTFVEQRGAELLSYEFTLPDVTDDLFPTPAVIAAPSDGDTVMPDFLLDWDVESTPGAPVADGVGYRLTDNDGFIKGGLGSDALANTSATIPYEFDEGVVQSDAEIRVILKKSLEVDIVPVSPGADALFPINLFSASSFSEPVQLTLVIPEPSSLVAAAVGAIAAISSASRRWRT